MKKILIIIDMQKGFVNTPEAEQLVSKIKQELETANWDVVIATKFINSTGSLYRKRLNWNRMSTEEEQEICGEIAPYVNYVVEKYGYSGLTDEMLTKLLEFNDSNVPEEVYLCGMDTDACVLATAFGLFDREIFPNVIGRLCASSGGQEKHNAGITCIRRSLGITI